MVLICWFDGINNLNLFNYETTVFWHINWDSNWMKAYSMFFLACDADAFFKHFSSYFHNCIFSCSDVCMAVKLTIWSNFIHPQLLKCTVLGHVLWLRSDKWHHMCSLPTCACCRICLPLFYVWAWTATHIWLGKMKACVCLFFHVFFFMCSS